MKKPRPGPGFSLLEIVVALGIFASLFILFGILLNSTSELSHRASQQLDADSQSRLIFQRMAIDFAGMLKRKDADAIFSKQTGDDRMFFYSRAPGYFAPTATHQSALTLVGYRINGGLERLAKGLTWSGSPEGDEGGAPVFLTYPKRRQGSRAVPIANPASTLAGHWPITLGQAPDYQGVDDDYHPIGPQIVRMEICFLLRADRSLHRPAVYSSRVNGLKEVAAIVVALAIVEPMAARMDEAHWLELLPDPTDADLQESRLMASIWQQALDKKAPGPKGRVRIYQSHFPLP